MVPKGRRIPADPLTCGLRPAGAGHTGVRVHHLHNRRLRLTPGRLLRTWARHAGDTIHCTYIAGQYEDRVITVSDSVRSFRITVKAGLEALSLTHGAGGQVVHGVLHHHRHRHRRRGRWHPRGLDKARAARGGCNRDAVE
jgi:hypothetical protein